MSLGENQLKKDVIQWRGLEVMEARERPGTNRHRGLTLDEAGQRLAHDGPHRLPPPRRRPAWRRFLLEFGQFPGLYDARCSRDCHPVQS